ncbi:MAG TPA: methyl-accepting chemotaxis protein [Bryobacteraceae bacterium]|nr:methyl-accepting chemotaxis protein [Bryobacteraceae bacterium]
MKNLSLTTRLNASFSVILLVTVVLAAVSWKTVSDLSGALQKSTTITAKKGTVLSDIVARSGKMRGSVRGVIMYTLTNRPDMVQRSRSEFAAFGQDVLNAAATLGSLPLSNPEKEAEEAIQSAVRDWIPILNEISRLCASGQTGADLDPWTRKSIAAADRLDRATDILDGLVKKEFSEVTEFARSSVLKAKVAALPVIALAIAAGIVGLLIVARSNKQLRTVARELGEGAGCLSEAATHVSRLGHDLAGTASRQAASTEETSAAAEEVSTMARKIVDDASVASGLVAESRTCVETGAAELDRMSTAVERMNASTESVSKIIRVIEEIALQTNILALNAAVEAARVGNAGAGFAIVADEVRTLAKRSAQAANETSTLIVDAVESCRLGASYIAPLRDAFSRIRTVTGDVSGLVEQLHESCLQQSIGMQQIGKAMTNIEQGTQHTAASAEQSAAAGEQMLAQASTLHGLGETVRALVGIEEPAGRGMRR